MRLFFQELEIDLMQNLSLLRCLKDLAIVIVDDIYNRLKQPESRCLIVGLSEKHEEIRQTSSICLREVIAILLSLLFNFEAAALRIIQNVDCVLKIFNIHFIITHPLINK